MRVLLAPGQLVYKFSISDLYTSVFEVADLKSFRVR